MARTKQKQPTKYIQIIHTTPFLHLIQNLAGPMCLNKAELTVY